jgi:hypothetical protein
MIIKIKIKKIELLNVVVIKLFLKYLGECLPLFTFFKSISKKENKQEIKKTEKIKHKKR